MTGPSRREVVIAGHSSDPATATAGLTSPDAAVRLAALGALDRLGRLTASDLTTATVDPAASVRRRAAELAASRPDVDLLPLLADDDVTVVEMAAWSCGERQEVSDAVLDRLIELTTHATEPLVRESCAAALGAIGDARGLPAILAACEDKPAVRRRAVLALAPFDGDDVRAAVRTRPRRSRLAGPPSRRGPVARVERMTTPPRPATTRGVAVQVRLVLLEADAAVQAVGGLAAGSARQADVLRAAPPGLVDRRPAERLADPVAARRRRRRRRPRSTP